MHTHRPNPTPPAVMRFLDICARRPVIGLANPFLEDHAHMDAPELIPTGSTLNCADPHTNAGVLLIPSFRFRP